METKNTLETIYIDLRNCDIWEKKQIEICTRHELVENKSYPFLMFYRGKWDQGANSHVKHKTELTYPEFIKLFEGGEGENNGWIKIEESNDLPKQRGEYWFVSQLENGKIVKAYFNPNSALDGNKAHYVKLYSHYQPLIKPEPPKF